MARSGNDKDTYASYPKDSYDTPPAGPVGVHRGARSAGARALPFIIVLIVAVLAGLLFWAVFSGQAARVFSGGNKTASEATTSQTTGSSASAPSSIQDSESPSASETSSPSDEPEVTDSATPGETSDDAATPSETSTAQVNYATTVSVVNGTGVSGYAAQEAAKLQTAGFTDVTAGNPSGALPDSTVVWYASPDDEATAREVANALGIANVQQANIDIPVMAILMN